MRGQCLLSHHDRYYFRMGKRASGRKNKIDARGDELMCICSKHPCPEGSACALFNIELGEGCHEVHAGFWRGEGCGLFVKKVGDPLRELKLKSWEGILGAVHDEAGLPKLTNGLRVSIF